MSDKWDPHYPEHYSGPGAVPLPDTAWTRLERAAEDLARATGLTVHEARLKLALIDDEVRRRPPEPMQGMSS